MSKNTDTDTSEDTGLAAIIIRDEAKAITEDLILTANINARFASERAGRGVDGWESF